ncbi:hypothetical protein GF359_02180 [candidate division WOR-3 bacterium]|uniref:PKD domain-containing protein n=1 Tax=candidate division WOR-3 bacterium TaxID=2052148 RepID=A0A9D5QCH9_UNCW3|nr:hypothetical protein [candidate division WOR-3 bacterium]MBD3364001.1 hypothetical protein [candidate division WOR-3 bacterium]
MRKTLAILAAVLVVLGTSMGCEGRKKTQDGQEEVDTPQITLPESDIFSGEYEVEGPDYEAILKITKANQGYHLEWTFPDGDKHYGKGIALDGILGAVYDVGDGSSSGMVAYKKSGDGITGLWTPTEGGSVSCEKTADEPQISLGRLDVRGDYEVEGTDEDSTEYTGILNIEEKGPVFSANWTSGPNEIHGTGFVLDDVLILNYGNPDGVGIVVYEIHGTQLTGFWLFCPYENLSTPYPVSLATEKAKKVTSGTKVSEEDD